MRIHAYIQDNDGEWVEISERVSQTIGEITFLATEKDWPSLAPPTQLVVSNKDGWWQTEPADEDSRFYGAWEGRKVKLTESGPTGGETSLGIFRIDPDHGFRSNRDGTGALTLESLVDVMQRGDASDVSQGRGWMIQAPYSVCIDRLKQPEDVSIIDYPDPVVPYEAGVRAVSPIGRPGDYLDRTFREVRGRGRAVAQTWNEAKACHAWITLSGRILERDRDTGVVTELSHSLVVASTIDCLNIYWRRTATGDGYYLVVMAANSGASAYYEPREGTAKGTTLWLGRSDTGAQRQIYTAAMMPCIVRDFIRDKPVGGTNPTSDQLLQYGNEFYGFGDTAPPYTDVTRRREPIAIPFDQYAFPLQSRSATFNADLDRITISPMNMGRGWGRSILNALAMDEDLQWTIEPIVGATTERYRDSEMRAGAGLYNFTLYNDDGTWDSLAAADYRSGFTGLRHCLGQGALYDVSFEHTGGATYEDYCWIAMAQWTVTFGWAIDCYLVRLDGTPQIWQRRVANLGFHKQPTFVICDMTRPTDHQGQKGAVIVGWIDYESSTTNRAGSDSDTTYGSCWMARSGIDVYPASAMATDTAPAFHATGGTVVKFTDGDEGDLISRAYNGGHYTKHPSGRWTPVAMGYKRHNDHITGVGYRGIYNCAVSCLDRMELLPHVTGNAASGEDHENGGEGDDRSGTATYRILFLRITIESADGSIAPTVSALSETDTYGPGYDIQAKFPMPPMGLTRIHEGDVDAGDGDEQSLNTSNQLFFYSPADRGIYAMRPNPTDRCKPFVIGRLDVFDPWMALGRLAVGHDEGDITKPEIAGTTSPVFPGSSSEQWPLGQYFGWTYGAAHNGRIPLLETSGMDKITAIARVAGTRNAIYFQDRDGQGHVRDYPAGESPLITLRGGHHFSDGIREFLPVINIEQRSVSYVQPGKISVTTLATPKSRFQATPTVTGLGIYPVALELRCIGSGLASTPSVNAANPSLQGKLLWGWKNTSRRIHTTTTTTLLEGATVIYLADTTDIQVWDRLTMGATDVELLVTGVNRTVSSVNVIAALNQGYPVGSDVYVDKEGDGAFSHLLRWDDTIGIYVGISTVAAGALAGATRIAVTNVDPFNVGTYLRIHSLGGLDTDLSRGTYRVVRVRPSEETGKAFHYLEIEGEDGGGLTEDIQIYDPITAFLNIPPTGHSVRIGQTGVFFGLAMEAGDSETESEQPISEGDTVRIDYPGLELKKDEQRRVSADDQTSIAKYGKRQAKQKKPNEFMDDVLANLDVARTVRMNAEPRLALQLTGVKEFLPADREIILGLNPWDVVRVVDDKLLREREFYTADFTVTSHTYDPQTGFVKLDLEELDTSTIQDPVLIFKGDAPTRSNFEARGGNGEVILSWTNPAEGGYGSAHIRYSTTGFPLRTDEGTALGSYAPSVTSAKKSGATNGTTYYFSCFFLSESATPSKPAFALAVPLANPDPVTSLSATEGDEEVTLEWTDPSTEDVHAISIWYRTDGTTPTSYGDGTCAGMAPPGAESFVHAGLQNGLRYRYAVYAVDHTGNASSAATVDAIPDFDPEAISDYVEANWTAHSLLATVADGGTISALADSSSAGHNLTQYHPVLLPTLDHENAGFNDLATVEHYTSGAPGILLGATVWDPFTLGATRGATIIVVAEMDVVDSAHCLVSKYSGAANYVFTMLRGNTAAVYEDATLGASGAKATVAPGVSAGVPGIFALRYLPSMECRGYGDGVAEPAADEDDANAPDTVDGSGGAHPMAIGSTYPTSNLFDGRWAQIIMLSEGRQAPLEAIMAKLRRKYQIGTEPLGYGSFNADFNEDFDIQGPEFNDDFNDDFNIGNVS